MVQIGVGLPDFADQMRDNVIGANAQLSAPSIPSLPKPEVRISRYDLLLTTAHDADNPLEVSIAGDAIWVVDGTDNTSEAEVRYTDNRNALIPIKRGFFLSGVPFKRLAFYNSAQADKTLNIIIFRETNEISAEQL